MQLGFMELVMDAFKSFVISENNGTYKGRIDISNPSELKQGDVLIQVKYSSINYYDALAFSGDKNIYKSYPVVAGLDVAGIVVESSTPSFVAGDKVITTGAGLGTEISGGFGEYVRVAAKDVITLPIGLSLKEAMTIGTEGLAAALAILNIKSFAGIKPETNKPILVTGARYGTGLYATHILSSLGYNVVAVSNAGDEDFVKDLGASSFISSNSFADKGNSPLLEEKYAAVIATMGGKVLSTGIKSLERDGVAVICGYTADYGFEISKHPFLFRGINLLGVDAINCDVAYKANAWNLLSSDWYIKGLMLYCTEIPLSDVADYAKRILEYDIKGRVVINHEL